MGWHKCSRYWKYGASCPVRGMPAHEEEEEEEEDEEDQKVPPVLIPERIRRPAEPGSVVAVAEAIVREVQTRVVVPESPVPSGVPVLPRVAVPGWVPPVREIVVPSLFPSPVDVVSTGSTPIAAPTVGPSIGDKIVEGTIAAGMGVAMGIVAVPAVGWIGTIIAISKVALRVAPQAGYISLPSARTLLIAAGSAAVRALTTTASREPGPRIEEQVAGMIEELVVGHVYPTAAARTVTISKILAGLRTKPGIVSPGEGPREPLKTNPFGDWNDAFMAPGMYGPPPASTGSTLASTGAGAGGYLYDFGQYLNSQLGSLENPGGSPPPTTY